MKEKVLALLSGVLFSVGLGVSGMTQPHKVVGFLDFAGEWDPSLIMVMVGGIATYLVGFRLVTRRKTTLFGGKFQVPSRRDITGRLVVGSALFGAGWGLAGYCPGPALGSLGTGSMNIITFVAAMIAGMGAYMLFDKLTSKAPTPAPEPTSVDVANTSLDPS